MSREQVITLFLGWGGWGQTGMVDIFMLLWFTFTSAVVSHHLQDKLQCFILTEEVLTGGVPATW